MVSCHFWCCSNHLLTKDRHINIYSIKLSALWVNTPSPLRALRPPGWLPQWHCGVRVSSNKKLVGFISAIPADIRIYDTWAPTADHIHLERCARKPSFYTKNTMHLVSLCCSRLKRMVEINFLCVHKKLRSKRVAPVLIREITRRVNLEGIFQAVYTAGVVLPKPVSTCRYTVQYSDVKHTEHSVRKSLNYLTFFSLFLLFIFPVLRYWHRSLNPRKLVEVKFSHLSRNMTLQRTMKLYRLPDVNTHHLSVRDLSLRFL